MNKRLANLLTAELDKRIEGCEEALCVDGYIPTQPDGEPDYCPTCAQWRAWRDELCWHEVHNGGGSVLPHTHCNTCGKYGHKDEDKCNPTFTIQLTREWLERLGLYDKYLQYLYMGKVLGRDIPNCCGTVQEIGSFKETLKIAQSDTLNLQAVIAFMEERNE